MALAGSFIWPRQLNSLLLLQKENNPFGTWQFQSASQASPEADGSLLSRGTGEQSFYKDWKGLKILTGNEPSSPSSCPGGALGSIKAHPPEKHLGFIHMHQEVEHFPFCLIIYSQG